MAGVAARSGANMNGKRYFDMTEEEKEAYWARHRAMTPEEQQALWEEEHKQDLEDDFQEFMNSPFQQLRDAYYDHKYNREDALILQQKLEERLGVKDPNGEMPEEGWRRSSWCTN